MQRGIAFWLRTLVALTVAMAAGSLSANAQTSTTGASAPVSRSGDARAPYVVPDIIEPPQAKRIRVSARPVARGEIAIFDPIAIRVGPLRMAPKESGFPDLLALYLSATRQKRDIEVPPATEIAVSGLRAPPDAISISAPLVVGAAIERTEATPPSIGNLVALPVLSAKRQLSDLDVTDPETLSVAAQRGVPGTVAVGDPVLADVAASRRPLSVADAEAAIAACRFESIRNHLRRLVGMSDQIDRDGRKVVAELSRLNRANTAFETARLRYEEGKLDEAKTLLVLAEQTHCEEREADVEAALAKIERLNTVLAQVDRAIEACNIPALTSLRQQLAGQTHVLLTGRVETLESMAEPAAIAAQKSAAAGAALVAGRLEQAATDLTEAEQQLASITDVQRCLDVRQTVAEQRREVDRQMTLVASADGSVAACDINAMTALSRRLEAETGSLLTSKKAALDAVNTPAAAARAFATGARVPFEKGEIDDAEAMLRDAESRLALIEDLQLCPSIRDSVAQQLAEIDRVGNLVVDADRAIAACVVADLGDIGDRLVKEEHILLTARGGTIGNIDDAVATARRLADTAENQYVEGNLDAAEARANEALASLATIAEMTQCAPIRTQVANRLDSITDVRGKLAGADRAIAACNVPDMRAFAARLEGADHTLLVAKRAALLDIGAPVADANTLNDGSVDHYLAGRLDDAEQTLKDASDRLARIESCAPLKEQIAQRLGKIDRMRTALSRVDEAIAACEIRAMTAMGLQLEGHGHTLLAGRLTRIAAVNTPATAAHNLSERARSAFDAGDLSTAAIAYKAAAEELAKIEDNLCDGMRTGVTSQLATIETTSQTLDQVEQAVAACSLPDLQAVGSTLEGQTYVLLAQAGNRVAAMADPLSEALASLKEAGENYETGNLDRADSRQQRAADALSRINGAVCGQLRQQVTATAQQIGNVRGLLADADRTMAACGTEDLDRLAARLSSVDHRLLRSKQGEVDSYFRPVSAAWNLGDAAKQQYFEGNIDIAEARLGDARRELAERPECVAMFEQIERRADRIEILRKTLKYVDGAISLCHIPAMTSMSRQLDGQGHVLLRNTKAALDRVMVPASTAQRRNDEAWPLFENGQLVAAQTRLEQALDQLDQIAQIDRSLCLPLRREIESRLDETDRVRSTLVLVDSALSSCNHGDIDLLLANLTNASHVSLVRGLQDLKAGRLRCGLSDAEKLAQAEATCRQKHSNSIVDEFNPQTGRYTCVCPSDYMWDPANAACVSQDAVREASNRVCESGYPNSVAVHIRGPNQFECNCRDGYVWNQDETGCVSADVVVQDAVAMCAKEGGYPAEIEGADRFTCCPDGTVWNRARRECVPADDVGAQASGGDPQCRWVANTGSVVGDDYICTCDQAELCGPPPASSGVSEAPAATESTTAAAATTTPTTDGDDGGEPATDGADTVPTAAPATGGEPEGGFVDRVKKIFGNIF
ncbi:MAG: hypothetical protein GY791_11675 [Alphaproteobacteria bacterium]|nr:hypothetical protein [Alphaproteobacteria bacterium]